MREIRRTKKVCIFIVLLLVCIQALSFSALAGYLVIGPANEPSSSEEDNSFVIGRTKISVKLSDSDLDKSKSAANSGSSSESSQSSTVFSKEQRYQVGLVDCAKPKLSIETVSEVESGALFKVVVTSNEGPIKDAKVTFFENEYITDENGCAILKAPQVKTPVKLPITAKKSGYLSAATIISIGPSKPNTITPPAEAKEDDDSSTIIQLLPSWYQARLQKYTYALSN
jgi:hypothetical protein